MIHRTEHVVIVGAGLAGLRTIEQLRNAGFAGSISLIGAELHPPYDRPPLSKQFLSGQWDTERIILRGFDDLIAELGVTTYSGVPAIGLDDGRVDLADGQRVSGDAVVIATGVAARALPHQPVHPALHTLRTLDDALALRRSLDTADTLLIIGGGFIGAEVASTASARGIAVTVLESMSVPYARTLGDQVGAACGRVLTEAGVDFRVSAQVDGVRDGGSRVEVDLADGSSLSADVTLVGIGGVPQSGWLLDTGLDLTNGVACQADGRVKGLSRVWAVGDVACWDDPVRGRGHRIEHWTNAADQAATAARSILGQDLPQSSIPYVWSDQFGLKLQVLGWPDLADAVLPLHGAGLAGGPIKGTVVGYLQEGRLIGTAAFGAPRIFAKYRPLIAARVKSAEVQQAAAAMA